MKCQWNNCSLAATYIVGRKSGMGNIYHVQFCTTHTLTSTSKYPKTYVSKRLIEDKSVKFTPTRSRRPLP